MTSLFPPSARLRFRRQPLTEVICQLRFAEEPFDASIIERFRAAVGERFPAYQPVKLDSVVFEVRNLDGALVPGQSGLGPPQVEHVFLSADAAWKLALAPSFISLSTSQYTTWDGFSATLAWALGLLVELRPIASVARTGLRYINTIRPRELGLGGVPWSELLQPSLLGMVGEDALAHRIVEAGQTLVLALSDQDSMRLNHGLSPAEPGTWDYVVDADCFVVAPLAPSDSLARLGEYRAEMGRFFRWACLPRLQAALEPEVVNE